VQRRISETRVAVLDPSCPSQDVQHLTQHISHGDLQTDPGANHAATNSQIPHSLATPDAAHYSSDGTTTYIPAFGSSKIRVFTCTELEDTAFETHFDPTVHYTVPPIGPHWTRARPRWQRPPIPPMP
jgi:hypothetical protein